MNKKIKREMTQEINSENGKKVKFLLVTENKQGTKLLCDFDGSPTEQELNSMAVNSLVTLFNTVIKNTDLNPVMLVRTLLTSVGAEVSILSEQTAQEDKEVIN